MTTVEYRGFLQTVTRSFPTHAEARAWAAAVGRPDARITITCPVCSQALDAGHAYHGPDALPSHEAPGFALCPGSYREPASIPVVLHVSAYAVTQRYGGPEEGGWYYDAGAYLGGAAVPVNGDAAAIRAAMDTLRASVADMAEDADRLSIDLDDEPGASYPTERPFYE